MQRYDSTVNHPTVGRIIIKANAPLQKKEKIPLEKYRKYLNLCNYRIFLVYRTVQINSRKSRPDKNSVFLPSA